MSTTPIGNSDYLRVWDNTGNNLNPSPSDSIIDNGFLPDTKTDSSILNYAINILGQKVNQSLAYGSPQWSPNNAYKIGSTVNNSGNVYISKVDNNLNKVPYVHYDYWDLVATSYSPNFTGIPTAPTAPTGDNTTQLATTAFVKTATNSAMPTGTIIAMPTSAAPSGYLPCEGAEVSRTSYANLFAVIGKIYGAGDGSTTFRVPDFRAAFLRGFGTQSPQRISEPFGVSQGDTLQEHKHISIPTPSDNFGPTRYPYGQSAVSAYDRRTTGDGYGENLPFTSGIQLANVSLETRPYNFAVLYCIKY